MLLTKRGPVRNSSTIRNRLGWARAANELLADPRVKRAPVSGSARVITLAHPLSRARCGRTDP